MLHFPKGQMPPAKGFWSVTMYDADYFFVKNPIDRYNVSSRSDFKYNNDGSLDIYIQKDSPGKEKEANWLPAPAGKFVLKYTLDTKKNPVTISMKMTEGAGEGATAEGIVKVKGDELTICYAREGDGPKTFEAKEGSNFHLFVLKRSK